MIQDLGNHVFHNEYQPVPPTEKDYILHYQNHEVLANTAKETLSFPFGMLQKHSRKFTKTIFICFP